MEQLNIIQQEMTHFEKELDSFNPSRRKESLQALMALVNEGSIQLPKLAEVANLHCHSFYSYNGYGYSPSLLAWLGRKLGIKLMGIVDFDVLDGVDEFLEACETTGIRGTAGIETRVYIPEFRHAEINSPGEPGIAYHMGTGFVRTQVSTAAAPAFAEIRQQAIQRNQQIVDRINDFINPLKLDFEKDILPLTPGGYATERHIIQKIAEKSFTDLDDPIRFWVVKLKESLEVIEQKVKEPNTFKDYLRQKLIKRGGVAYVQPEGESFPTVEAFHEIILAENAIPCSAWLDGTSRGEEDIERLLDLLIERGAATINIIPDRNWNIQNDEIKAVKLKNLYHIVDLAESLDLPILVGTEMNSFGQKHVDDFSAPELAPVKDRFVAGAYFLYGHTIMEKLWGMGYQSDWSQRQFPDRKSKNAFYESVGRLIPPNVDLDSMGEINEGQSAGELSSLFAQKFEE
jgi:hypothetical protein